MNGNVVIVDAYAPTRRLAPEFRKAGYDCVRVQSTPEIPTIYRSEFSLDNYIDNIVHDGDLERTIRAVASYRPVAVVPGEELGVEFSDLLSEQLDLPTNETMRSVARRDKYTMVETIKAAGVRGAKQLLVENETQLSNWHRELDRRIVVKPTRSAAGDGVYFCDTPEQSVAAFRALIGAENIFSLANKGVVAQEYLSGGEYMVNTVSRDGRHHVCDIWKTTRLTVNDVLDLCDAVYLVPRERDVAEQLVPYAYEVLDALGIRHGPAHLEIKLTPTGPCLVEVGGRIAGADIPYYAYLALGESQLDWTVDAYVRPGRFRSRYHQNYRVRRFCASVAMLSPVEGTLRAYSDLERIERLESFHELRMLVRPGDRIRRTVDDLSYPLIVTLLHEVEEVVMRDLGTIRYVDGEGFYHVDP